MIGETSDIPLALSGAGGMEALFLCTWIAGRLRQEHETLGHLPLAASARVR